MTTSTGCSCRERGLVSGTHLHGGSEPTVTAVLGIWCSLLSLLALHTKGNRYACRHVIVWQNFSLGRHNIYSCQIVSPRQTKVQMPPKSNVVNQWDLYIQEYGLGGHFQEQKWVDMLGHCSEGLIWPVTFQHLDATSKQKCFNIELDALLWNFKSFKQHRRLIFRCLVIACA